MPRLVSLFAKRNGDVGLSSAQLTGIAREALGTKAEKQVLTFPQGHLGGAVHASALLRCAASLPKGFITKTFEEL